MLRLQGRRTMQIVFARGDVVLIGGRAVEGLISGRGIVLLGILSGKVGVSSCVWR